MKELQKNKIYDRKGFNNFKDITETYEKEYKDQIAFKYKLNPESKNPKYINITYKEFKNDIDSLATSLLNMGLENKRVAIIAPNRYEWCVSYLAVTTSNIIVVPLDKSLPENEIEGLIIRSKVDCVIFDEKYLNVFTKLKKEKTSNLKYYICMDYETDVDNLLSYKKLVNKGRNLLLSGDKRHEQIKINNEEMSIILFTSGTTSLSKAVMLSQKNICSNISALRNIVDVNTSDTFLSFLPLHHTFESTGTFLFGTSCGITIAFCDGLKYVSKNMEEYKVTAFICVPLILESMYKKIQKGIEKQGKTKLINIMIKVSKILLKCGIDIRKKVFKPILDQLGGHLRLVVSGAAPINKETLIGFNNFGIEVLQGYGLTETAPVLCAENDKYKRPGSTGFALEGIDIKIFEPNENGVGEIIAKGPNIMLGYYEDEEATQEVLKNGWFYTGDLGYIDSDGYIYIVGRKKTVIVLKNGKNIYPEEVEVLINNIPFVKESMVYGQQDKDGDLSLACKIVYDEDIIKQINPLAKKEEYYNIILNEIKKINKTMPPYKYIRNIKITTEGLIKTTTQKIKRHEEMKLLQAC